MIWLLGFTVVGLLLVIGAGLAVWRGIRRTGPTWPPVGPQQP
jgi:hypothetical protein